MRSGMERHMIAWVISGVFAIMSCIITLETVYKHLKYFTRKRRQRNILRILLMVPTYAMDSWLALRFKDASLYLDTIRDCCQSWATPPPCPAHTHNHAFLF